MSALNRQRTGKGSFNASSYFFVSSFDINDYYCPPDEAIKEAIQLGEHGHMNVIDQKTGFKIDIYPAGNGEAGGRQDNSIKPFAALRVFVYHIWGQAFLISLFGCTCITYGITYAYGVRLS